jgi:polyhydroxybutyrate depolymerase
VAAIRCTPARTAQFGSGSVTFHYLDEVRSYLIALPAGYDGRTAAGLIFNFHGFTANKELQESTTLMGQRGAARGYIVVTPDALANPRRWNTPGDPAKADDFGFVHALAADLEERLCIDPRRVYAAGHSNGSQFAAALVCRAPYIFAAVALVSGTPPFACPNGVAPAMLSIHGTADQNVPYRGGTVGGNSFPVVPDVVKFYATHHHCDLTPTEGLPFPGVVQTRYTGCTGGGEVTLDTVVGGTHPWPGGNVARADHSDSAAGKTFDATGTILTFFGTHIGA